ncbi:hypothetical protein M3Y99_00989200 [Aphelenchoides fujianensis]|nr:hypothetical protein M3Y99_00989200 [Aphelenchoides fujianensis]
MRPPPAFGRSAVDFRPLTCDSFYRHFLRQPESCARGRALLPVSLSQRYAHSLRRVLRRFTLQLGDRTMATKIDALDARCSFDQATLRAFLALCRSSIGAVFRSVAVRSWVFREWSLRQLVGIQELRMENDGPYLFLRMRDLLLYLSPQLRKLTCGWNEVRDVDHLDVQLEELVVLPAWNTPWSHEAKISLYEMLQLKVRRLVLSECLMRTETDYVFETVDEQKMFPFGSCDLIPLAATAQPAVEEVALVVNEQMGAAFLNDLFVHTPHLQRLFFVAQFSISNYPAAYGHLRLLVQLLERLAALAEEALKKNDALREVTFDLYVPHFVDFGTKKEVNTRTLRELPFFAEKTCRVRDGPLEDKRRAFLPSHQNKGRVVECTSGRVTFLVQFEPSSYVLPNTFL